MKKIVGMMLVLCMIFALAACGGAPANPDQGQKQEEAKPWDVQGYFADQDENMLSVTLMEDVTDPGWYVGAVLGDFSGGGMLKEGINCLHGELKSDDGTKSVVVTVTANGADGISVAVDGGETYTLPKYDMPEAKVSAHIDTEGMGNIAYAEGENIPEFDPESPYQSTVINLEAPATYTLAAEPQRGYVFVKWTKDGNDFSTEPIVRVNLDGEIHFVAVFEEDPDWQNPVMNFVGHYESGKLNANVEAFGAEDAWITIERPESDTNVTHWDIAGTLDGETLTMNYTGSAKQNFVYNENGEMTTQDFLYENGTGTIVFNAEKGTMTWHEDLSETGNDIIFDWVAPIAKDEAPTA